MGKKVKNKDLAERLGVSCTLVSLVLNNKSDQHGIKKETRERVLAMARQMGLFDQGPVKQTEYPVEVQPGIIGMVVPSMNEPDVYELTGYMQKAFASIGIGFTVIMRDSDDMRFSRFVGSFRRFFAGLILYGNAADEKTIRTLKEEDFPFVIMERESEKYRVNTVMTDEAAGAGMLSRHFAKLGYERILLLASSGTDSKYGRVIKNFTQGTDEPDGAGIKYSVEMINETSNEDEIDFNVIKRYFKQPLSIQAILVMNPWLVYPVMKSFEKRKIRIPQDVALVSFEDIPCFDFVFPPVTALRRPLAGLALKSANMIWAEIKNAGKSKYRRQVSMQPSLVVRKSCGSMQ